MSEALEHVVCENERLKAINAKLLAALQDMYSVRWHATKLETYVAANKKAEAAIREATGE